MHGLFGRKDIKIILKLYGLINKYFLTIKINSVDETGIYADPSFEDIQDDLTGDFSLTDESPCINMGAY